METIKNEQYENEALKRARRELAGKSCAVIGVGISNLPLIRFLTESGAAVTARDRKPKEELFKNKSIAALESEGVRFICGEEYLDRLNEEILFKTPGLRFDHPALKKAHDDGARITSEMELFLTLCPARIFAVTGSDGKTTTTTLIAEMLEAAGFTVHLGGNIGRPLLYDLPQILPSHMVVLELSSFQLHSLCAFGEDDGTLRFPDVAVLTNISPNHLDWHSSYEEYMMSKKAIYTHLRENGKLVTNAGNAITATFAEEEAEKGVKVRLFSAKDPGADYYADEYTIYKDGLPVLSREDILLPGTHNVENYMAAMAATESFVPLESVKEVARTFGGVEHRLEFCGEIDGVSYYNSSIDSSPSRSIAAITSFPESDRKHLILIMGGYDKHIPYAPIGDPVCKTAKAVFLCGATADKIREAIEKSRFYGEDTEIFSCESFRDAVEGAAKFAERGDKVILTPASASFDLFRNFEERGKTFKDLVKELSHLR